MIQDNKKPHKELSHEFDPGEISLKESFPSLVPGKFERNFLSFPVLWGGWESARRQRVTADGDITSRDRTEEGKGLSLRLLVCPGI